MKLKLVSGIVVAVLIVLAGWLMLSRVHAEGMLITGDADSAIAEAVEIHNASPEQVTRKYNSVQMPYTVEARYIERDEDPLFDQAVQWEKEMKEIEDAFYSSRSRTDAAAREELRKLLHEERLQRFDTNGDGEIDEFESEIKNRPQYERSIAGQKTLDRFDLNRDLRIDAKEQLELNAYYRSVVQQKLDALLPRYDTDGDGCLSNDERTVYQMDVITQAGSSSGAHQDKNARRVTWLTHRLDMNGDSRVDMDDTRLFLQHLARGSVIADLDRDGFVGLGDYDTHRSWSHELRNLLGASP